MGPAGPAGRVQRRKSGEARRLPFFTTENVKKGDRLRPRTWLGVYLAENSKGVVVRGVIPKSAAKAAKLSPGDILGRLGDQEIKLLKEIRTSLDKVTESEKIPLTYTRGSRKISTRITPELALSYELDIRGDQVRDKVCSEECNCDVDDPKARCHTTYIFKGAGPNGGVLYQIRCLCINGEGFADIQSCGPFEFF